MLKKTLLMLVFALQFAVVIGQGLAYVPEPECLPCPSEVPPQR